MSQLPSIRRALREFGVEATRVRRAWHSTNQKYRVTSVGGSVFGLRVGRPWSPTHRRARSICTWVASLGEAGFAVPAPLRTTGGDWIAAFSDADGAELACTLETWLPGRRRLAALTPAAAAALGRLLGGLHQFSREFRPPPSFEVRTVNAGTSDPPDELPIALARLLTEDDRGFVDRWRARLSRQVDDARAAGDYGVIVGDFGQHNVVWHQGTPQLVDFGDTAWGAYAYDLGYICELLGPALDMPLLESYASVARLPAGLPVMRAGYSIKVMGARAALPHGPDVVRTRVKRLAELDAQVAAESFLRGRSHLSQPVPRRRGGVERGRPACRREW